MTDTGGDAFFGRGAVLGALGRHLDTVRATGRGRIVAIRGRRQVGKSTVVERFVEQGDVPYIFVSAVFGAPLARQLAEADGAFTQSRRLVPGVDVITASSSGSWRDWFGRVAMAAQSGPVVVVLDEFPWLAGDDGQVEGDVQVVWDRTLERLPVLLILVGSDVTMMERIAEYGRPLFGRVNPLVVPALNPAEVAGALPGRTPFDVFDAYLVTGGYPRLVAEVVASGEDIGGFVRASFEDAFSPLVATGRIVLDAEFPDSTSAYQVLSTIGADDAGRAVFNTLVGTVSSASELKRAETQTTRALTTLTEVKGIVEREVPAWAPPASRLRRYRVTDPYLRFWFRYVQRQVDVIARGRSDLAVAAFERDWSSWRGRSIEPVVRDALTRLARDDERLPGVETVRPWWTRDGSIEVDVVAASKDATPVVGTIKWRGRGGVTSRDIDDLRRARNRVPRAEHAALAAVSSHGSTPKGADIAFTAADLLAAWR